MNIDSRWLLIVKGFAWSLCIFIVTTIVAGYVLGMVSDSLIRFPQAVVLGIPWGAGITIFVFGPLIYMWVEHRRQALAVRHREEWNWREMLEENAEQFVETFGGQDIRSVMEKLREKRLSLLAQVELIARDRSESPDEKTANEYMANVRSGIDAVRLAGKEIEKARELAAEKFGLEVPPASFFLGPNPIVIEVPPTKDPDTSMDEPAEVQA